MADEQHVHCDHGFRFSQVASYLWCLIFCYLAFHGWQSGSPAFWPCAVFSGFSGVAVIWRFGWLVPSTLFGFLLGLCLLQMLTFRYRSVEARTIAISVLSMTFGGTILGVSIDLLLRHGKHR